MKYADQKHFIKFVWNVYAITVYPLIHRVQENDLTALPLYLETWLIVINCLRRLTVLMRERVFPVAVNQMRHAKTYYFINPLLIGPTPVENMQISSHESVLYLRLLKIDTAL